MKFFNIFSKENRNKLDDEQIKNFKGKDVAKSNRGHQSAINGYENTIAENKKLKQGRKIKREFAWEKAKTAIRLNLKNLTSLDDIGTEKQSESNRIKKEYEERLGALNLSEEQKSILESGTYSKKAVRQSNKDARKGIRKQKRKIASNNSQAFLTKRLREGRKVGLFALGVITAPAKLAVDGSKLVADGAANLAGTVKDGVVKSAEAVSQKVTQVKRNTEAGAIKFIRSAGVRYEGGDKLPRKFMEALGAKVSQSKIGQAIGSSLKAVKNTALEARGRYADKASKRLQNRQDKLQRWAAARPSRE